MSPIETALALFVKSFFPRGGRSKIMLDTGSKAVVGCDHEKVTADDARRTSICS